MTTYYNHQCKQCGRLWSTKYEGFYVCPGCTRVPRLRGVWLRFKYRLLGKMWGHYRTDFFISDLWSPKLKDTLDANIELGQLVSKEYESDSS